MATATKVVRGIKGLRKVVDDLKAGKPIKATRLKKVVVNGVTAYVREEVSLRARRPEATIGTHSPSRSRKVAAKKRRKMPAATKRTLEGRFGVRLRELLDAKKWEVGDLHEQLKRFDVQVEKPAIHAWLRGDTMPKARDLEKIGQALGMPDYRQLLPPPG